MRVAAYDCGTNSLRLLVADLDAGRMAELARDMRIVRLGEGVDRTGRISDEAMERMLTALTEFDTVARSFGVERTRFCATSAARDAENAADFAAAVRGVIGVEPEVIPGAEEAALSFAGAVGSLGGDHPQPYLVVDIGGGSTEFIVGGVSVEAARSLDIGSVRLTERHFTDDPPTAEQIAAATADVEAALDTLAEAGVDLAAARTVVGVAGTVTTIAAGVLDLAAYDRDRIHHADLPVDRVRTTIADLIAMSSDQRRALAYMHPGRADVIGAGALILDVLLRRTRVGSVLVSEHDILDGIALSCATNSQ
jgi:exopolyphosphatase/guanosine-5'-triphosphate,3'-diphosphate pyrophosphatase